MVDQKMTPDLTPGLLARVREVASKATPGPWVEHPATYGEIVTASEPEATVAYADHAATSAYIATLSPNVALALVDGIAAEREAHRVTREALAYIKPALPVLRTMCAKAGLSGGAAKADEMIATIAAILDRSPR